MNNSSEKSLEKKIGIGLLVISFLLLLRFLLTSLNLSIWCDEVISLRIVSVDWVSMISAVGKDFHPPLYYIILKAVLDFFNFLSIPVNKIILAKLVSIIPLILLLVVSFTKIRENFGWLCAGIFSLCIIGMPQILRYGIEIRMYTWALLFLTIVFIYAYQIMRESNLKNWTILTIFSLLTIYTRYIVAVPVILIYLGLMLYLILKNKEELKKWIISVITVIILFLPWLPTFIHQLKYSSASTSWVAHITLDNIQWFFWFILSANTNPSIDGILLFSALISVLTIFLIQKKEPADYFAVSGILILVFTVCFAVVFAYLTNPMFITRDMVPLLGCFWLGFSILVSKNYSKKQIFIPILIVLLVVSFVNIDFMITNEEHNQKNNVKIEGIIQQIEPNDVIIYTHSHCYVVYSGFNNSYNDSYLAGYNNYLILSKNHINLIPNALSENKTVWIFYTENGTVELKDLENISLENGYDLKKVAIFTKSLTDDQFPTTIYRISPT